MKKILVVDDEFQMRKLLRIYLENENYKVYEAEDGKEACKMVLNNEYDLIIMDVMMPKMDGWKALQLIRESSVIPIIMLTARGTVHDKVAGFSNGADDYLVKPFEHEELIMRVRAILRRVQQVRKESKMLKHNGIVLNLDARILEYQGNALSLTQTEFDLLRYLIQYKGKVLSRAQLVELVWGVEFKGDDRTVDSHIKNLREKLSSIDIDRLTIKTVWGIGYKVG